MRCKNGRFVRNSSFKGKHLVDHFKSTRARNSYENVPERRIVDLRFFGEKLDKGCSHCGAPILFKDIDREVRRGLCSLLHFKCNSCKQQTSIATSRHSKKEANRKTPFTVNVKAAIGMIHAGIGTVHVNNFLTTIGIPHIHHKTMKRLERVIGPVVEETARSSCETACYAERDAVSSVDTSLSVGVPQCGTHEGSLEDDEQQLLTFEEAVNYIEAEESEHEQLKDANEGENTASTGTVTSPFPPDNQMDTPSKAVGIVVSQDAAWSKRGRGMNSLSGVGHVIGEKTKKCLKFATRVKNCAKCKFYERTGRESKHSCRKNWKGSAKSMEPDIATDLHQQAQASGLKFIGVIGDEDSSSIKHIKEKVNKDIIKYSDFGHLKRSLRGKLLKLQNEHKALTRMVQDSFVKNLSYAVKQNKSGSEDTLINSLNAIVPHMYGEHDRCGSWCKQNSDPNNKTLHRNLPRGQDLTDPDLRIALENVLAPFMSNPVKLMTSGSTQPNESLNNVIWSKAPKTRNYNASESFDFRCAAAVLQYNEGTSYVNTVVDDCKLTPQKATKCYTNKRDSERRYGKLYKEKAQTKRRRCELKKLRHIGDTTCEIKEGTSYEKGCVFLDEDVNIEQIPDTTDPSVDTCVISDNLVFYDLETTSLANDAEIIQLSACVANESFNQYIMPHYDIDRHASAVHKLRIETHEGERQMYKNGIVVPTLEFDVTIKRFVSWLQTISNNKVTLVAHNGKSFDMKLLLKSCSNHDCIDALSEVVNGFADTLPLFRSVAEKGQSVSLPNMYRREFGSEYNAHDSLEDTKALMRLFQKRDLQLHAWRSFIDFAAAVRHVQSIDKMRKNRIELEEKLCEKKKVISRYLARKISSSGLSYDHLKLAHARGKANGLRCILSEKVNSKSRVTSTWRIINELDKHFTDD